MKKKSQKLVEELLERKANRRFYTLLLSFLIPLFLIADVHFSYTTDCIKAQKACYELRLDDAQSLIEKSKAADPDNLSVLLLEHLRITLKAFVTEDDESYAELKSFHAKAYKTIAIAPSHLAHRKFAMAELDFQLALIKGKKNDFYSAARLINNAHKLLKSNHKQHPDFALNKKTLGLINAYLSSVPKNYDWAMKLLGFKGNLEQGLSYLKEVSALDENATYGVYSTEGAYLYAFTLSHVANRKEEAWISIKGNTTNYRTSGLATFFRANLAGRLHMNEEQIVILENRPKGKAYQAFPILDYMLGVAHLNSLSPSAIEHLKAFYNQTKGKHYIKACLHKMSWFYLLFDEKELALVYKSRIEKEGSDLNEEDKLAMHYASKVLPHKALLKARLLFDGGYYKQALNAIKNLSSDDFSTNDLKAEYSYRKGRIFQMLGNDHVASLFFIASTKFGVQSEEYYAAYACLQLGSYYLSIGDKSNAELYYKKANSYKNNKEFKDSIEQQSIAGLSACKAL
ncbi:MAG: hypothetical protein JXR19_10770 [Bacteroidia bacterium]